MSRTRTNTALVLSFEDIADITHVKVSDLLATVNESSHIPYDMAVELAHVYGTSVSEWR